MTALRSRAQEEKYKKYLKTVKNTDCVLCTIEKGSNEYVDETDNFRVVTNKFAYSLWDGQKVSDHMMITPKRHTSSLAHMQPQEKIEYVDLLERYESLGYDIYARAPSSTGRSIIHQHTHLIKLEGSHKRFVLLLEKPYFRIVR